jgi:hypothetical protein
MAKLNDLEDVTISNPKVGDVVKYTATGWQNGADAGSEGVNGNPCGTLDHYTRDDREETITEPWTWEIEDDECLHIETPTQKGFYCANKVNVSTQVSSVAMRAEDNGDGAIKSVNKLIFKDAQVPSGVSLAELVAGNNSGGDSTTGENTVMSVGFKFNGQNQQWTQNVDSWKNFPTITDQDQRLLNYKTSDPVEVELPEWATGCALIYTQRTEWRLSDNIKSHPLWNSGVTVCFRNYTVHRLKLEGGTFVVGYPTVNDGKDIMANVISTNTTLPLSRNIRENASGQDSEIYINGDETSNFQIIKLNGTNKKIKFTQIVDWLGGGWGKLTASPGKIMLLPIRLNPDNIVYAVDSVSSSPNTFVGDDAEYSDMLDEFFPPYTKDDSILQDTQELKRGIVHALNVCNDALAQNPGDSTIEGIRSNLYDLKTETSLEFAEARFKVLVGDLDSALAWKFDWEPAGYSLI